MSDQSDEQFEESSNSNYKVVTGLRKGSVLYEHEGFLYYKSKLNKTTISLRCQLYSSLKCPSTASLDIATNQITVIKGHCHDNDDHELPLINLKNDLKDKAAKSAKPNRELFDQVCREHNPDVAAQISFPNVTGAMTLRKCERYPCLPNDACQFVNLIENSHSDLKLNYQGSIYDGSSFVASVFFSERLANSTRNFSTVCYDGTFFIVPKIF